MPKLWMYIFAVQIGLSALSFALDIVEASGENSPLPYVLNRAKRRASPQPGDARVQVKVLVVNNPSAVSGADWDPQNSKHINPVSGDVPSELAARLPNPAMPGADWTPQDSKHNNPDSSDVPYELDARLSNPVMPGADRTQQDSKHINPVRSDFPSGSDARLGNPAMPVSNHPVVPQRPSTAEVYPSRVDHLPIVNNEKPNWNSPRTEPVDSAYVPSRPLSDDVDRQIPPNGDSSWDGHRSDPNPAVHFPSDEPAEFPGSYDKPPGRGPSHAPSDHRSAPDTSVGQSHGKAIGVAVTSKGQSDSAVSVDLKLHSSQSGSTFQQ